MEVKNASEFTYNSKENFEFAWTEQRNLKSLKVMYHEDTAIFSLITRQYEIRWEPRFPYAYKGKKKDKAIPVPGHAGP
jgi:hypothetical protein